MKKALLSICLLSLLAMMVGCTSSTQYGQCIGLGEEPDPRLNYKVSAQNLAVGLIFIETIIVPVFVAADQFYCPTGVKP
jgi:hypothetical protein